MIGPNTVNTLPYATLEAFESDGTVSNAVTQGLDEADKVVAAAQALGIDLDALGSELETNGAVGFVESFDEGLAALEDQRS